MLKVLSIENGGLEGRSINVCKQKGLIYNCKWMKKLDLSWEVIG